ncbi:Hypothetical_protein [Hexamita inflata]|uniref:Hypothetical_protein n=1 Tax=Hexamita inflata TaxID=28002 RepID=A0AA86P296_9EUKA|nr:Hypothetical protein HINF_LOCUS16916 [Hexamita inflata]CAI9962998.1 Hypothetical protein HINF_LOCUS50643 [Hexamita inflata]
MDKLKTIRKQRKACQDFNASQIEVQEPLPIERMTEIRKLFTKETDKPKVYSRQQVSKLRKPVSCYIPLEYRKKLVYAARNEKLFTYDDLEKIFEFAKDDLADEVHQYYHEMVDDRVQQQQQVNDQVVKKIQTSQNKVESYIM